MKMLVTKRKKDGESRYTVRSHDVNFRYQVRVTLNSYQKQNLCNLQFVPEVSAEFSAPPEFFVVVPKNILAQAGRKPSTVR